MQGNIICSQLHVATNVSMVNSRVPSSLSEVGKKYNLPVKRSSLGLTGGTTIADDTSLLPKLSIAPESVGIAERIFFGGSTVDGPVL